MSCSVTFFREAVHYAHSQYNSLALHEKKPMCGRIITSPIFFFRANLCKETSQKSVTSEKNEIKNNYGAPKNVGPHRLKYKAAIRQFLTTNKCNQRTHTISFRENANPRYVNRPAPLQKQEQGMNNLLQWGCLAIMGWQ